MERPVLFNRGCKLLAVKKIGRTIFTHTKTPHYKYYKTIP